ncbi:MAG TPA: DUF748 domain-containing protein, partial [Tepidisphaeraceae bacterium]|nr:DUF748 domain-containing protein [Tepidisphaeraceae bacterium]
MSITAAEASPAPAAPKSPKKPNRWRRRGAIAVIALVVLGFAARILLPLTLPMVLRRIAGNYGLTCQYDRLELNLLSGDAGIWGVEFRPKEGGDAVVQADYAHGNLSVLHLLRGRLDVWRVEADGVDVNVEREADGRIPLLERFISRTTTAAAPSAPSPAAASSAAPKPIDLTSPLKVEAFRLQHLRLHVRDRSLTPALDTVLAMDLRLSNLGSPTRPAHFEMNVECDPMLDSLQIDGEGHSGGKTLDATINVLARGIRLKPLAAYLQPLGIRPVADGITLRASGRVRTAPTANDNGFAGALVLDKVSATADQQEALALDRLSLDATSIDNTSIRLSRLALDGVRAIADRDGNGRLRVAGVEWDPSLIARPSAASPHTELGGTPTTRIESREDIRVVGVPPNPAWSGKPSPLAVLLAEPWSLGEIVVTNLKTTFHDQSVTPAADLSLVSDQIAIRNIDHNPHQLDTAATLAGTLSAPGIVQEIKLSGSAKPFAAKKAFLLAVDAHGIRPDALRAYLDQIGVESHLQDAAFSCSINGSVSLDADSKLRADANLETISLSDGGIDLLKFPAISMAGASLDPATGRIRVDALEVSGPTTSLRREHDGALAALGLRTKRRVASASAANVAAVEPAVAAAPHLPTALPLVEIGHFAWSDAHIELADDAVSPGAKVNLSDLGVDVTNFRTTAAADAAPGQIRAWFAAPNIADRLSVDGTITPASNGVAVDLQIDGRKVTAAAIAPYLASLGVEPVLQKGTLAAHARAEVSQATDGLKASLSADHVRYSDGDRELAAVDALNIKDVGIRAGEISVGEIDVDHARAAVARDADNSFLAAGVRVRALTSSPGTPGGGRGEGDFERRTVLEISNHPSPLPEYRARGPELPFAVVLGKLHVSDSSIDWNDAAVQPSVSTTASVNLDLDHLTLGRSAGPAALSLSAKVAGTIDDAKITGTVLAAPDKQAATLEISATGVRAGALAAYLPPGTIVSLKDGQFHTKIDAAVSLNPAGGRRAELLVTDLNYRDGADGPTLLSLDSVKLAAPRIDLPSTAIAVDELSVAGLETSAQRTSDGAMHLLGIELRSAPPAIVAATAATAPSTVPAAIVSASDLVAAARQSLPLVTIAHLNLGVRRLTLSDASLPQPIVVSDLSLTNIDRIEWLGKDPAGKAPTHLRLTCRIDPVMDQLTLDALVAPFAQQPSLQLDVLATGVRGDGLTALAPALKANVDGSQLTDGRLAAHFETAVKLERRSPLEFDLSRGCDVDLLLKNVEYRAMDKGPVLAGLEELRADAVRIEPANSLVHARTLEITKPIGFVTQDEAGIRALGWLIKLPANVAATQPVTVATDAVATEPATAPAPAVAVATKPWAGDVRIDQLLISGLDARFEDHSCDPPLVVPLNGLDVEVRDVSTRSLHEPGRPIRFNAIVNGGKVRLPKRGQSKVKSAEQQYEQRELFSQITVNGSLTLYPQMTGWAKTSVSGLELTALAGPAKRQNVTLRNGTYDSTFEARMKSDGVIETNARLIFTDLSVSEPADGPIAKLLKLPGGLDG